MATEEACHCTFLPNDCLPPENIPCTLPDGTQGTCPNPAYTGPVNACDVVTYRPAYELADVCAADPTDPLCTGSSRSAKPSSNGGGNAPATNSPVVALDLSRKVRINGEDLDVDGLKRLAIAERYSRARLGDASYWYDSLSGLYGPWKGPATGVIAAGVVLGGAMPANASAGGTGIFANGRELHPFEAAVLRGALTIPKGRYWLHSDGTCGREGSDKTEFNVLLALRAATMKKPAAP